jgi:hypothetical protein
MGVIGVVKTGPPQAIFELSPRKTDVKKGGK